MYHHKIRTIKAHDKFIKDAMQHKEVAQEFFTTHLPKEILALIDLNTLKPAKDTFIDETLGENLSDMVFEVRFNGETGYLSLLLEHQSSPDYYMPLRIMKYMLQVCSHHLKANPGSKYLPLVYPIIIYHSTETYTAPPDYWGLFATPELAKKFYTEELQVIDVTRIPDEELRKKLYSGVMNYLLKHIFAPDIGIYLDAIAPLLKEIADKNFDYMMTIICYTINKAEGSNSKQILEKLTDLVPEKNRSEIMTIADQLRAEARQQGMQQGMQQGVQQGMSVGAEKEKVEVVKRMLSNNLDVSLISLATGLTQEEVLKIEGSIISFN